MVGRLSQHDSLKCIVSTIMNSMSDYKRVSSTFQKKRSLELLAPAGNMDQACCSIESGCDAIYGGLENWNARMRAKNFSLNEYRELLNICHQNGVRFYMTLNTLFRDDELHSIRDLFSREDFPLPDAVIATDIGLMKMLSDCFPSVDIHASTQYGASSLQDIMFLQEFNIKRVILARELTLSEIAKIREKTNIELEVFVYGSQCICFSGQCLWGGITQECSGNRGRCPAPCRDFYRQNDIIGHLLYPQDIDASHIVDQLIAVGVDSIKIEGRFRDSEQTGMIVKCFRNAINNPRGLASLSECKQYVGYLHGEIPVKSMLNYLNPRTKLDEHAIEAYGDNDFYATIDTNKTIHVANGALCANKEKGYYIKTIIPYTLRSSNDAVTVSFEFRSGVLFKIDLIDNLGSLTSYRTLTQNLSVITFQEIVEILRQRALFPLGEIISNTSEQASVKVCIASFYGIIKKMNEHFEGIICARPEVSMMNAPGSKDYIQIDRATTLAYFKERGYRNYVFDITSKQELEAVILGETDQDTIIYKLPVLDFTDGLKYILPLLENRTVLISRLSHLLYTNKYHFKNVIADYTLNLWNSTSLSIVKKHGISMFTAHPEVSLKESAAMSEKADVPLSVIYMGRIPIGYTRACFGELKLCDKQCSHTSFQVENMTKKYLITVACNNSFGYRTLLYDSISIAYGSTHEYLRRYIFSGLCEKTISDIISGNGSKLQSHTIYGRNVL